MTREKDRFDGDTLRISLVWGLVWVFVVGVLIASMSDPLVPLANRLPVLYLAVLCYLLAYTAWVLEGRQPLASRWVLCIGLVALITLGIGWLGEPGFMMFWFVPVLLARAQIHLRAAFFVAVLSSLCLLLLPQVFVINLKPIMTGFGLITVWSTVAFAYAMYRPMYQISSWALEHYDQARFLLEEARDRKAELQETRDELLRSNRELLLLNERLQVLRQEADEARKAKAMFVSKVSHEFRTPLNMIIGLADLLIDTPDVYGEHLSPTLLDDLKIVQRNCQHLSSLVEDVLNLGQMEAGTLALNMDWVDLRDEIELTISVVQPLIEKRKLYMRTVTPANIPQVRCDRVRIRQVILNLVSNAVRFTTNGGITLSIAQDGDAVVITVADTGPGIKFEDTERIFEPFFQGSGTNEARGSGSGLGLSISRQFVELHQGRIWLESVIGVGTTFHIRLPISPVEASKSAPQRWLNENWGWQQRTTGIALPRAPYGERIMLLDEARVLAPVLSQLHHEIEVVPVQSIESAQHSLEQVPAHLLLMNAPTGEAVMSLTATALGCIPDTPIVVCQYDSPVKRVLEAGAQAYLTKPLQAEKLVGAVRSLRDPIHRVLIVDDNAELQSLLSRMLLAHDSSLAIATVSDGCDALPEMQRFSPDLILLDLSLPGLDGWQILAQKQADDSLRSIPTFIVSAQDPSEQPMRSTQIVVGIQGGIAPKKMLDCALELSRVLLSPA